MIEKKLSSYSDVRIFNNIYKSYNIGTHTGNCLKQI